MKEYIVKIAAKVVLITIIVVALLSPNVGRCKEPILFYVTTKNEEQVEAKLLSLACDILGIKMNTYFLDLNNEKSLNEYKNKISEERILSLSQEALEFSIKNEIFPISNKSDKRKILIIDLDKGEKDSIEIKWYSNKIPNVEEHSFNASKASLYINKNEELTKELGGLYRQVKINETRRIKSININKFEDANIIIQAIDNISKENIPIFVNAETDANSLFLLTSWKYLIENEKDDLIKILPFLIFLKNSFKTEAWHHSDDYANFTIDDPGLVEPYGFISYKDLCKEAMTEKFHVTIAFIPYNYNKYDKEAVKIFNKCKNSLSLSIHGNNHDFKEFRQEDTELIPFEDGQLIDFDEFNILQALHRMNKLNETTGIGYDKVMVFPRGEFSKKSLKILKKHNFSMTINSTLPIKHNNLDNKIDKLRSFSLQYSNFPLVLRLNVPEKLNYKMTDEEINNLIQVRLFLDYPVLLYGHVGFFEKEITAFNRFAKKINSVKPNVIWSSLGKISENLFLEREISKDHNEVMAFSSVIALKNTGNNQKNYTIKKKEDFLIPISRVLVDGKEHDYVLDDNAIKIYIRIDPGDEKKVIIEYNSEMNNIMKLIPAEILEKTDYSTHFIRNLSNFRDIYLIKIPYGVEFINTIYRIGGGEKIVGIIKIFSVFSIVVIVIILYKRKVKKYIGT